MDSKTTSSGHFYTYQPCATKFGNNITKYKIKQSYFNIGII